MIEMSTDATRCKQCGKVIVGGGKMGLCDSCFNKDVTRTAEIAGGGFFAYRFLKKNWKTIINGVGKLVKKFM